MLLDDLKNSIKKNKLNLFKKLLNNDNNFKDELLIYAVNKRKLKIIKYLIENYRYTNKLLDIALMISAEKGYFNIFKYLIKNGSNFNSLNIKNIKNKKIRKYLNSLLLSESSSSSSFSSSELDISSLSSSLN